MTELIVRPIDLRSNGSFRERSRFMRLIKDVERLNRDPDASSGEKIDAYLKLEDMVTKRLATDDETSVDDALDALSANDFDRLLGLIAFTGGGATVDPTNADNSATPVEASEVTAPTG